MTAEEESRHHLAAVVEAEQAARAAEAEARSAIARTERIKDALLVAVSHEVRTPLTVLQGRVETLRRPEFADDPLADHDNLLAGLKHNVDRLRRVLLDAADRDRVFGAFEHGDVAAHNPGSGVGLFLVARFTELHGGRAWVTEAAGGGGASFRVELPLDQPAVAD